MLIPHIHRLDAAEDLGVVDESAGIFVAAASEGDIHARRKSAGDGVERADVLA